MRVGCADRQGLHLPPVRDEQREAVGGVYKRESAGDGPEDHDHQGDHPGVGEDDADERAASDRGGGHLGRGSGDAGGEQAEGCDPGGSDQGPRVRGAAQGSSAGHRHCDR